MVKPPFRPQHIALLEVVMNSSTLSEAARRLNVTQPAVSKQLAQLQADLGFPLFERKGHRLTPTFEARAMLEQVGRVSSSLAVLNQMAVEFRTARPGHLQIGCIPSAAVHLLPQALGAVFGPDHRMSCTVHTGSSQQVTDWVQTQQVDIGIALKVEDADRLGYARLLALRLECLLPASHPLARLRTLRGADLQDTPLIGLELPSVAWRGADESWWDQELTAVRIRVDSSNVACAMVEAGLGVAVADSMTVAAFAGRRLVRRPFAHAMRSEIGIYRPSYRPRSEAANALTQALQAQAALLGPLS